MWERRTWVAIVAALGMTACKVNGKSVGWPGGSKGTGDATSGNGSSGSGSDGDDGSSGGDVVSETPPGERPAWCDVEGASEMNPGGVQYTLEEDDARDAVYGLIGHFCAERPTTERRAELEVALKTWSKRLMMNDADWRDAVDWAMHSQGERNGPTLRVDNKKALSELDAVEQYALLSSSFGDRHYLADALEAQLTVAGRMGYVEVCLNNDAVGFWVMCHADVLAFDPAKITAELRKAKTRSGYERTVVRLRMDQLSGKVAERIAAVAQLEKKDPAYGKLFAIGADVHKKWAARGKGDASLKLALTMDDAQRTNSRSGFESCEETTWAAFAGAVSSAFPAKRFAELADSKDRSFNERAASIVLDNEDVYLASLGLIICAQGHDKPLDYLLRTLAEEMAFRPGSRGPRTATHAAMLTSGITLDDRDARIEYPDNRREWLPRSTGSSGGGQGVVSSVEETGKGVVVSFVKEMATYQECTKTKTTKRIDRIDASGNIYYEEYCTKYVKKKYDKASNPQTVAARYATGVKKGTYVKITEDVVTLVRSKQDGDPIAVFGVAVK